MKSVVAIVRCPDYRPETLDEAIKRLQLFIGGFEGLIQRNDSVFLKINHLGNHGLEHAVNTHPEVVSSLARSLRPITNNITVGDGLDTPDMSPFATTGYTQMCRESGLKLVNFCRQGYVRVEVEGAQAIKRVPIGAVAAEADFVVTLPKLKTHMLTLMTGAVKNNYGYLPHEMRVLLHREHISPTDFAGAVVDVYAGCKAGLVVMDAITALEGAGPALGGRPRHLGLLIGGRDAVAVDAVASAIIGLDPMGVATTRMAHERGLGMGDLSQIEVVGCSIEEVRCADFAMPPNHEMMTRAIDGLPRGVRRLLSRALRSTRQWPRVKLSKCTGCGVCAAHCPQDTIEVSGGKARINYDECISCFCCLEFCPANAMRPRRSMAGGVMAAGTYAFSRTAQAVGKLFAHRRG